MASVSRALARIKQDLRPFLCDESIERACAQAGHVWRERLLGPVATVHLFILQVLHFNTSIDGLRRVAKVAFGRGSYCDARQRLPLAALQSLLRSSSAALREAQAKASDGGGYLWRGLRPLLVDGSSTIAPDTPQLDEAFGHPTGQKAGCGFPVPKVLGLFDALTGLVAEMLCFPLFTHDMGGVAGLHPLLGAGDLLVGDRGLCSFAHLTLLHLRGVLGLFRMHQRTIVDFRPHRRHGARAGPRASSSGGWASGTRWWTGSSPRSARSG